MAYQRVNWEDSPSTATPLTAENLNKMDKGIADAFENTEENSASIKSIEAEQKNLSAKVEQNTSDINTIKTNEKMFEKAYDLGTVTSIQTLISYRNTGTLYTGTIAFTADFKGDFTMWIVSTKRILLCSDGTLWVFKSLTTSTATKVTYSVDDVDTALALKANKADVDTSLAIKENLADKVSDKVHITSTTQSYPSVEYLNQYYYDFEQTDEMLAQKYDASNVESGTGTFTVVSDTVKPFIKSATFQYQKVGKSITLFGSIQFNEGVLPANGYIQFSGIPFRAIANSRVVSSTSKYANAVVTVVAGTWVSLNFATTQPRQQDESMQFSVNYLIN